MSGQLAIGHSGRDLQPCSRWPRHVQDRPAQHLYCPRDLAASLRATVSKPGAWPMPVVAAGQLTGEAGMRGSCWPSSIQAAVSLGVPGISRTVAWAAARETRETR